MRTTTFYVETMTMPPQHQNQHLAPSQVSGWKSPVPYLFGGLAAMLGLIAFALLILACSYWKLSGYLDTGAGEAEESEAKAGDEEKGMEGNAFKNSVLVIMAGQEKPTCIATPVTSRASSFGDSKASCSCSSSSSGGSFRSSEDCEDERGEKGMEMVRVVASEDEEKS